MASTVFSSATATGISPMCVTPIFWPMKPTMGSLVQIKSDTYVAWMGGIPNSDQTDLKISPSSPPRSAPCLMTLVSMSRAKVWMSKLSKQKGDLFSFQHKLLWHFPHMGMDTITYLKDPEDPTKMVNLLMDHT